MRFIHYSSDNKILNKYNLIPVDKTKLNDEPKYTNDLNPGPNVLFLSMENEDGHSDWYNSCVERNDESWINGTKIFLKLIYQIYWF